ncbi:riboflavin kinase/FMN adenylyltransferase [Evansella vedderi]|uniref:FAD synthase n=1 Tax=Evansella vedderi TaxID=38282 RepID=A0ABU0A0W9_9BACI|nr:FAD synthetase family protein [Evansella vedderi]MDQ0257128.1 riboflavin kinase/FMN adenylyltransferase [Evansella vedderi]
MRTIYLNPENLAEWQKAAKPTVMALGFFDGLHKGHQKVIETAKKIGLKKGLSVSVMSFFPHPKTVLSKGKKQFNYLMPLSMKEKVLQTLGVDTFYIVEFDREFSSLSPKQFVHKYLINLGVVHAVAGFDYTYGFKGEGNMDRIRNDSGNALEVSKVAKVECKGEKISSTCIREKLLTGNINDLPSFLGRLYEVECCYDGKSLHLKPYYTLPASGRYIVTFHTRFLSKEGEVIVSEKGDIITQSDFSTFLRPQQNVTITWLKRSGEIKDYPLYKNEWKYSEVHYSSL